MGPPNINKYIPKNCFININDFNSYEELYTHLIRMDESRYLIYIKNIKMFLLSSKYKKFTSKHNSVFFLKKLNKLCQK